METYVSGDEVALDLDRVDVAVTSVELDASSVEDPLPDDEVSGGV